MELTMKDTNSALTVKETTFGREFNEALIHQVVVAYANGGRQGSVKQKNRPEVSGGKSLGVRRAPATHVPARSALRFGVWRSNLCCKASGLLREGQQKDVQHRNQEHSF